jgi:hypothetical protein
LPVSVVTSHYTHSRTTGELATGKLGQQQRSMQAKVKVAPKMR